MKKKLLSILLSTATIMVLTACGEKAAAPAASPASDSAVSSEVTDNADEAVSDQATEDAGKQTASIGKAYFTPGSDNIDMMIGAQTLHAYFEAADVVGAGDLTIVNADTKSAVMTLNLAKASEAATPDDISSQLSWEGGTHLLIHMDKPLDKGYDYYVTLSEGAFQTKDGSKASKEVTDAGIWNFGFYDYGISLGVPNGSDVYVDDHIPMTLFVEGAAKKAVIEGYDENRVRFEDKESECTVDTEIKIYQIGEDSFTVTFYDNEHTILGKIPVTYNASMPPVPEEEVPEHSVVGL